MALKRPQQIPLKIHFTRSPETPIRFEPLCPQVYKSHFMGYRQYSPPYCISPYSHTAPLCAEHREEKSRPVPGRKAEDGGRHWKFKYRFSQADSA